mmetsp:Transcript_4278/g.9225  ORF Transcript_4278/g.9225 Transcript_4278/m.9225 type:complete len:517 (-) Transcript_4278:165-1715(-)
MRSRRRVQQPPWKRILPRTRQRSQSPLRQLPQARKTPHRPSHRRGSPQPVSSGPVPPKGHGHGIVERHRRRQGEGEDESGAEGGGPDHQGFVARAELGERCGECAQGGQEGGRWCCRCCWKRCGFAGTGGQSAFVQGNCRAVVAFRQGKTRQSQGAGQADVIPSSRGHRQRRPVLPSQRQPQQPVAFSCAASSRPTRLALRPSESLPSPNRRPTAHPSPAARPPHFQRRAATRLPPPDEEISFQRRGGFAFLLRHEGSVPVVVRHALSLEHAPPFVGAGTASLPQRHLASVVSYPFSPAATAFPSRRRRTARHVSSRNRRRRRRSRPALWQQHSPSSLRLRDVSSPLAFPLLAAATSLRRFRALRNRAQIALRAVGPGATRHADSLSGRCRVGGEDSGRRIHVDDVERRISWQKQPVRDDVRSSSFFFQWHAIDSFVFFGNILLLARRHRRESGSHRARNGIESSSSRRRRRRSGGRRANFGRFHLHRQQRRRRSFEAAFLLVAREQSRRIRCRAR